MDWTRACLDDSERAGLEEKESEKNKPKKGLKQANEVGARATRGKSDTNSAQYACLLCDRKWASARQGKAGLTRAG